jgi:eukaryotic-like serine/threonine-protein kinase
MSVDLRELDFQPIFAVSSVTGDIPDQIFARRATRMGLGAIMDAIQQGELIDPELPLPGMVLGKFRIEKMIGVGGFGVVYRARHVVLENVVAIKVMRPKIARARPTLVHLLNEEARFAARIDHPNVVRVHDVGRDEGQTYIVMEYVDGPDLSLLIKRRGAVPPRMVVRILRHIVAALAAGLRENLVHRDIKPSNILLTPTGVTKLTDFGLARSTSESAVTGLRGVVGTAEYMAPEQTLDPNNVDARSDVYALGVTAYHALTGQLPFKGADAKLLAEAHQIEIPMSPRSLVADVQAGLSNLVMEMLAKRPKDRPSNYDLLDARLQALQ